MRDTIPFLSLLLVLGTFVVLIPGRFATLQNCKLLLQQSAITMTVGFGMTFVIVAGSIDLSVGSIVALSAMVGGSVTVHAGLFLGILASLGTGLLCGIINGATFAYLRVPSFVVTLGTLQAVRGVTTIYSHGFPVSMPESSYVFGTWPGIMVVALVVLAITTVVYRYTVLGECTRAVGGDETVARLSGSPIHANKLLVFVISGTLAGLGGFMTAARLGVASPTVGVGYELDVIASVVLGGTPLTGGIGRIYGTILGAVIMSAIGNGLVILGIPSEWQLVVKGCILVIAVFVSFERAKVGNIK
ncbi:MAG TPA: ABC transporter permease [Rectinemataceae bacterium]|nr:ABC transporter permease [Rectinemataceae bacterium]